MFPGLPACHFRRDEYSAAIDEAVRPATAIRGMATRIIQMANRPGSVRHRIVRRVRGELAFQVDCFDAEELPPDVGEPNAEMREPLGVLRYVSSIDVMKQQPAARAKVLSRLQCLVTRVVSKRKSCATSWKADVRFVRRPASFSSPTRQQRPGSVHRGPESTKVGQSLWGVRAAQSRVRLKYFFISARSMTVLALCLSVTPACRRLSAQGVPGR